MQPIGCGLDTPAIQGVNEESITVRSWTQSHWRCCPIQETKNGTFAGTEALPCECHMSHFPSFLSLSLPLRFLPQGFTAKGSLAPEDGFSQLGSHLPTLSPLQVGNVCSVQGPGR